jgi:hypothetical protein
VRSVTPGERREGHNSAGQRWPGRDDRVPRRIAAPTEVLVRTIASVISPGTERAVTTLARAGLLAKARARALASFVRVSQARALISRCG